MAIDNDTSYELTGAQIKDLAQKIRNKADDNTFVGSSSGTAGSKGLVPAPAAGDQAKFLSGAGAWSDMAGSYSTTEQVTPFTWVDGRPIYKKTISCGGGSNQYKAVDHNISNLRRTIKIEGQAYDGNVCVPIPFTATGSGTSTSVQVYVSSTQVVIECGVTRDNLTEMYITLWYTKTTD